MCNYENCLNSCLDAFVESPKSLVARARKSTCGCERIAAAAAHLTSYMRNCIRRNYELVESILVEEIYFQPRIIFVSELLL